MPRPSLPADDLYARLEVPPDATAEAIEIAWRALLKRHHPDVAGADALELAKRINVAHDWLSDADLRARYDRERRNVRGRGPGTEPPSGATPPRRRSAGRPLRRRPSDPAAVLRDFVDRVGRLSRDELDRLSVADTTSIAFVASIHRFLVPAQVAALEAVERDVRARLAPGDWANPAIRDAILAAAHELILAPFLDEHLTEPSRGRARERLMRGWEAAIDQPRYGPNSAHVARLVERAAALTPAEGTALARASGRVRGGAPWPRGLDPEEDETLRVSSLLAARDATAAAASSLERLDPAQSERARRVIARAAHVTVLRHGFGHAELEQLLAPWTAVAEADVTAAPSRPEPRVRRR